MATPPVLNGGSSLSSSYPFERNGHGVYWPPTPAEPPKTPEKTPELRQSPSPTPSASQQRPEREPDLGSFRRNRTRSMPSPKPAVPHFRDHEADGPRSPAHAKIRSYADDDARVRQKFPRISRPVELMRTSYDCVVIGSGYGGGVAASRMARAGKTVCLLELGKERWPGEYPSGTKEAFDELHCSGDLAPAFLDGVQVEEGDPTGMYHLIFGKGLNAVVCNGE